MAGFQNCRPRAYQQHQNVPLPASADLSQFIGRSGSRSSGRCSRLSTSARSGGRSSSAIIPPAFWAKEAAQSVVTPPGIGCDVNQGLQRVGDGQIAMRHPAGSASSVSQAVFRPVPFRHIAANFQQYAHSRHDLFRLAFWRGDALGQDANRCAVRGRDDIDATIPARQRQVCHVMALPLVAGRLWPCKSGSRQADRCSHN